MLLRMRSERLPRRGWAQALLVAYALTVLAVMVAVGGLPGA